MNRKQSVASRQVLALLGAVLLVCGLAAAPALAGPPVTVKVEVVMSGPPATMLPAGDSPAHQVGLGQRQGQAVFSDGRKAKYSNVFFVDLFRGQYAKTWGYTKMAFSKADWLFFKWEANFAGWDKAGKPTFEGHGKLMQGAGAYRGIKGKVKFTNRQLPPSKQLPKGGTGASAVITYTLPAAGAK